MRWQAIAKRFADAKKALLSNMNQSTITFQGKELEVLEWALQDLFDEAERVWEKQNWDKEQELYVDRIFDLLERVRKARNN